MVGEKIAIHQLVVHQAHPGIEERGLVHALEFAALHQGLGGPKKSVRKRGIHTVLDSANMRGKELRFRDQAEVEIFELREYAQVSE